MQVVFTTNLQEVEMKPTGLMQLDDNLYQAGKNHNLRRVCEVSNCLLFESDFIYLKKAGIYSCTAKDATDLLQFVNLTACCNMSRSRTHSSISSSCNKCIKIRRFAFYSKLVDNKF